ncbi:MAG: EAL domain-containing protein, partial [Zoogloeaceae bacterium]|nr:EAL domain-containing protein [Zoogloeaceae bacterium]
MDFWLKLSVRVRLILLFIVIKVAPLVLLVGIAWQQTQKTADNLGRQLDHLVDTADQSIHKVGDEAVEDAVNALDTRAREDIERLTTDTALKVAEFLYERDADIRYVATLTPEARAYRAFLDNARRPLVQHGPWRLKADKSDWEPVTPQAPEETSSVEPGSRDNTQFHYRPPVVFQRENRPLYLEMTFVGLDGQERVKVTTSPRVSAALKNVSLRQNTYAKAETYFPALQRLKAGEIYVSDVIGTYVGSRIIGKFTPEAAEKRGIPFEPEKHAYAGKENPVGKRFQGIVRWATPVVQEGKIAGYVTLALDHEQLMSFTDHIVPTEERYRDINDAYDGNYAFIWDYKGRSIVHPRHHSIVGYDENGDPSVPWLEDRIYDDWQKSGKSWREYSAAAPTFVDQLQSRKPARILTENGNVGLDCRFLNFAPQCTGWYNLADPGGSGSFLILWSGLWKLTTTAAIPYYTGQYSPEAQGNRRGFGIVTIGANVNDFHKAATESKERLDKIIQQTNVDLHQQGTNANAVLRRDMAQTASRLTFSTVFLIVVVIIIAIWMASFLSQKVAWLNDGFHRFRQGEKGFRFQYKYNDEITSLAATFNEMADTLNQNVADLEKEIAIRSDAEKELLDIKENLEEHINERTHELFEANRHLSEEIKTRRIAEEKAQYMAGHDPLTGLANRMLFNEQMQKAISQGIRSGKNGALLFFDLDHFKQINDTLGHAVGDELLRYMAKILQERVRKTDTAARLGGDEFAVVMTEIDQPESAAILAQDILRVLDKPVTLLGNTLHIKSSIGIATFHRQNIGNDNFESIIKNADMAMYQAKTTGGMRYCFFERSLQEKIVAHERLSKELQASLEENRFLPYFQPLYQMVERRVLYLEILARWEHPEHGLLTPDSFMETAAKTGIIHEIDKQIFNRACAQARIWQEMGLDFGRISFNILLQYLETREFVPLIQEMLARHQLVPQQLAFEIAEFALLKNSAAASRTLNTLRDMGVSILVDHLEIERSALRNLIEYPIDAIKINRDLTAHIGDAKTDAIISAISAIAHSTHLTLIAEGVESE